MPFRAVMPAGTRPVEGKQAEGSLTAHAQRALCRITAGFSEPRQFCPTWVTRQYLEAFLKLRRGAGSTIGTQRAEGTDVAKYRMKHRTDAPATKNEVFSLIASAKVEKLHQTIGPVII